MPKPRSPQAPSASPSIKQQGALAALRLSHMTDVTTAPDRQRTTIQQCADQLGFILIGEASDFGVSARSTSPFDRPSLSSWLRRPQQYSAIMWSRVDRAVRSVAHMAELIAWGRRHDRTLVFGMPEPDRPLVVHPQTDSGTIGHCMDLAYAAEQEGNAISSRLTDSHQALRAAGRYGGGLVPFGYVKAPHPSGSGWCLEPDPETASVIRGIVAEVHAGRSLIAIARSLDERDVLVPRDRHAQLRGRPLGGHRHGRDFEQFRWTSGTLSKVLRSPSLMGHRVHRQQTVRDSEGAPVLIGAPLLTEDEFTTLQQLLLSRSNGTRTKRGTTIPLLTGVAHCAGCGGRMYFAARKGYPHGDYACRASARGDVCFSAAAMRSDWLEEYTIARYREAAPTKAEVTRERLLGSAARVTVTKGRSGGGPARLKGPDTSRLAFTMGEIPGVRRGD